MLAESAIPGEGEQPTDAMHAVLQGGPLGAAERLCGALQEDGTMVLLDFGQCKALSAARQAALARLVIAMDQGWPAGVVRAMKVIWSPGLGLPPLAEVLAGNVTL